MDTPGLRGAGTAQRNATHASYGWPWMDTPGLRGAGTAQRNATHASHGWPWMDTPGLRGAGTAQRNATHVSHGWPGGTPRSDGERADARAKGARRAPTRA